MSYSEPDRDRKRDAMSERELSDDDIRRCQRETFTGIPEEHWLRFARAVISADQALRCPPMKEPKLPLECRGCKWLDVNSHPPLVPQGRPFCEQFRFCPPTEQYRHFGCTMWEAAAPQPTDTGTKRGEK